MAVLVDVIVNRCWTMKLLLCGCMGLPETDVRPYMVVMSPIKYYD